MRHRYRFLANYDESQNLWTIEGEEFFHLKKVLRLELGAEVEVFEANGRWGEGIVSSLDKHSAQVQSQELKKETTPKYKLGIVIGALQQQTFSDLLPCLVELGVDEIHIFSQEGTAKHRLQEKTIERWNKIILVSMKQCKRARMPLIQTWSSLEECLKGINFDVHYCLDPDAASTLSTQIGERVLQNSCLVLGSEKGLSSEERLQLKSVEARFVVLGSSILRSFTAAIAGLSILAEKRRLE